MENSAKAINKWFFFSMNYPVKFYREFKGFTDIVLPVFITEIEWNCDVTHIIGKWKTISETSTYGVINRFCEMLDRANRRKLIEYVLETYNDEPSI